MKGQLVFRFQAQQFWLGLLGLLMTNGLAVGCVIESVLSPSNLEFSFFRWTFGIGMWLFFSSLSLWMTMRGVRGQVMLSQRSLCATSASGRQQRIRFCEIVMAEWSTIQAGKIKVFAGAQSLTIDFNDFEPKQRAEFRTELRQRIPHDRQSGWQQFLLKFPTANSEEQSLPKESPLRLHTACMAIWVVAFALGVGCWVLLETPMYLIKFTIVTAAIWYGMVCLLLPTERMED